MSITAKYVFALNWEVARLRVPIACLNVVLTTCICFKLLPALTTVNVSQYTVRL